MTVHPLRLDEIMGRLMAVSNPDTDTDEKLESGAISDWVEHSDDDVAWLIQRVKDLRRRLEAYREGWKDADTEVFALEIQRDTALYFLMEILDGTNRPKAFADARAWLEVFWKNAGEEERLKVKTVVGALLELSAEQKAQSVEFPEELEMKEV